MPLHLQEAPPNLTPFQQVEREIFMWRYQGRCRHCHFASAWNGQEEQSRQQIMEHLRAVHALRAGRERLDYQLSRERQCDYCLEPYLDDCTKCRRDFCHLHAGDIDGLCAGCI